MPVKTLKLRLIWPFILWLIFHSNSFAQIPTADENPQQTLKTLVSEINALKNTLAEKHTTKKNLEIELEEYDKKIARASANIVKMSTRVTEKHHALQRLIDNKNTMVLIEKTNQQSLSHFIRSAYMMGKKPIIKMVLNQDNPARLSRVLAYTKIIKQSQIEQLKVMRHQLDKYRQHEQQLVQDSDDYQQLLNNAQLEKKRLETTRAGRAKIITELHAQISTRSHRLKRLKRNKSDLSRLVTSISQLMSKKKIDTTANVSFVSLKGQLTWPSKGKLRARYGNIRSGKQTWRGVLIAVKPGTPVQVIAAGQVVFADWLQGYGLLLIVDHGDNYWSLYGHNQHLLKTVGDRVKRNELVAHSGSSGGLINPALYFEIRHQGKPINPAKWIVLNERKK